MTHQLNAALARIHTAEGRIVGAGFLVGARRVLTCAHVVRRALALSDGAAPQPTDHVHLRFPLLDAELALTASVARWDATLDIAGLTLPEPPPAAKPVRVVASDDLWEHRFGAFGFPAGYDDGVWTSGVLRGRTANGRIQIDGEDNPGYWIKPGFSGAAIWDTELDAVVGMAVTADRDAEVKAAYMIPARELLAAWPAIAHATTDAHPACDSPSAPNPFCDRGRINDPARLFDRTRDLREMRQALAAGNHLSLVGARQIGKSSLLYALYKTAEAWLPDKRVHYIDLQGVLDEADFAAEVLEGLGHAPDEKNGLRAVKRALRRENLVLLLDEIEKLNRPAFTQNLHDLLRALAQRPTLTLAVASHRPLGEIFPPESATSPLHNIFTTRELGPFTAADARAFLGARMRSAGLTFAPAEIERLVIESGGHPARLQRLAYQLFEHYRGATV
jgi:hypothetical protein